MSAQMDQLFRLADINPDSAVLNLLNGREGFILGLRVANYLREQQEKNDQAEKSDWVETFKSPVM